MRGCRATSLPKVSYQIRVKSGASEAWVRGPAIDPSACKVPRSRMLQRDRPQDDGFKMVAEQRLFTRMWSDACDTGSRKDPGTEAGRSRVLRFPSGLRRASERRIAVRWMGEGSRVQSPDLHRG